MEFVYISIGLIVGFLLSLLFFRSKFQAEKQAYSSLKQQVDIIKSQENQQAQLLEDYKNRNVDLEAKLERKEEEFSSKTNELETEIRNKTEQVESIKNEKIQLDHELVSLQSKLLMEEKEKQNFREELERKLEENKSLKQDFVKLQESMEDLKTAKAKGENLSVQEISELQAENNNLKLLKEELQKKIKEQEERFLKIEENFKSEFKNMAQEILDEKSKKFTESGKKDLVEIIEPLKSKINHFSEQVRNSYENENKERFSLKEEIKKLNEMNLRLGEEAKSLSKALKSDSKVQGDWGEMILENILNESGLSLGREYFTQKSQANSEGAQQRPDVIVKYPDNRFLIIDSKVSLRAYEAWVNAEDPKLKSDFLKAHLKAVNDRMMELSKKEYQDNFEGSPDFVMLFMPIEGAYITAIQYDNELWQRAFEKRVVIISPTNLIAALKMINELWKHDDQNKNAQEIADAAANLYDKFVGLYEDLEGLHKNFKKVNDGFNSSMNKLSTGRGNLLGRVENLKNLGLKTKKQLNLKLKENQDA